MYDVLCMLAVHTYLPVLYCILHTVVVVPVMVTVLVLEGKRHSQGMEIKKTMLN